MAGNIKGIIVEIGGDTSGLQKALKNVNSATSSLSKELRGVNSLLKLDPSNTELVAQKQTLLSKNIEETSEKLKLLKDIQKQADDAIANGTEISEENYRALQREIANTENKLKTLQSQSSKWSTAGKAIEEFGNKITNVSDKVDKLGNTLTTSLTVPIIGLGTAAVATGNSFEAQMSKVQAIAGATKDELELLTNQAIQLGAETSFSATEVAAGMENLASAGFTTNEIMEAMPGLLDLAASSGAELATSSEIAASAIRGFGLEASEAGHVADVFAEAAARTNAQTEDMGEAMKYVAPIAKTVGLSIEETAAAIGIMSDAGIKGSQAGTTLRSGLVRIVKPTKQVYMAMEKLGVEFYDNEGKMKSLTEIIGDLQKSTKDLSDETKNQALAQIFGTEALSGMLALVNRGSDELEDMTKSFEKADGAAEEMADTMLDNTAGSLESLSGSIESAGIAIQKALSPEIRELSEWIQDLVNDFNNLSEEEQLNIIKTVALVAGIGPLIKILGTTGKTLGTVTKGVGTFTQAIGVLITGVKSGSDSVNNLAVVLKNLTSPTGLAVAGIAAVTTAIIYFSQKQTDAQKAAKELADEMANQKQSLEEYNQSVQDTLDANLSHIDSVESLKKELETLVDENGKVKDGYESRADFILNELNGALGTEYDLNGNIIDSYKDLQDEIDELIEKKRAQILLESYEEDYNKAIQEQDKAIENMKTTYDELSSYMQQYGTDLDGLKTKAEDLRNLQEEWFAKPGASAFLKSEDYRKEAEALENVISAYEDAEWAVQDYTDKVNQYTSNYELFVEGKYSEIGNTIKQSTKDWTDASLATIKTSIEEESKSLEAYKNIYKETGNSVAKEMATQSEENINALIEELTSRTSTIKELGEEETNAWKSLAENSFEEYSEALSKMDPTMRARIETATDILAKDTSVESAAEDLGERATGGFEKTVNGRSWGTDLTKEVSDGMTSSQSKNWITGAASTVAGWISDFLHFTVPDKGPLSDMDKSMPDMIDLMAKGIYNNEYKLVKAANKLATDLNNKLMTNGGNIGNLEKMQNSVVSRTIDNTKTIFTTPQITFNVQELDDAKLEQCFNYINRKFGSQY